MSIEQDTNEYHDKLAKFNRAVEAMIPVVRDEFTVLDSAIMDYFPEYYDSHEDSEIRELHKRFNGPSPRIHFDGEMFVIYGKIEDEIKDKWLECVNEEAKRRVEG